jgi:hypothetical protein
MAIGLFPGVCWQGRSLRAVRGRWGDNLTFLKIRADDTRHLVVGGSWRIHAQPDRLGEWIRRR